MKMDLLSYKGPSLEVQTLHRLVYVQASNVL